MDKFDALQFAAEEADHRPLRHREIDILPFATGDQAGPLLCPQGSITLFFVREGDVFVEEVRRAADAGDPATELVDRVREQYASRSRLNISRAWRLLSRQPVYADVRCGPKTLATNLFLPPDLGVGVLSFPYNGGQLPAETLTLVEHPVAEDAPGLSAVALSNPGPLTEIERAALAQVAVDQSELNIAPPGDCCPDLTGMVILVLMTLALDQMNPVESLSPETVGRLSAGATARELMEIRREALGHSH